jgi:hypothetical protein
MAELKTKPTEASVTAFIDAIEDEDRRKDCRALVELMKAATGASPRMWGESIVGFGEQHLVYATGRELDWFVMGFSPRKNDLTLYVLDGSAKQAALLAKLGKHKTGRSCLYLRRLADVDAAALEKILRARAQGAR